VRAARARRNSDALLTVHDVGRAGDAGATRHFSDPVYYDLAYRGRREDIAFYVRLAAESGGPVLELGVGTGRIALPIARSGLEVVGVDLSAPMLQTLRAKSRLEPPEVRPRLSLVRGDMRRVRLGRRFPLVIAPFNAALHLYQRRDVEQFLSTVVAHLTPSGRFVFDFSVPRPENLGADPNRRFGAPRFRHPECTALVRYAERFEYDPFRQILLVHMEFRPEDGSPGWTVPLAHRQFFPQEIEALLHYNGFSELRWYSDFSESGLDPGADFLAVSSKALRRRPIRNGG